MRCRLWMVLLITIITNSLALAGAQAYDPGSPAFARTWERTDKPVADGLVSRTWVWGPEAFSIALNEDYVEGTLADGTSGKRLVQYFDKARMELNDPSADPNFVWSVTNGLLATELITGRLQTGHNVFIERSPATMPVAGDPDDPNGPAYATFTALTEGVANRSGSIATERIDRAGLVMTEPALAEQGIRIGAYDPITEHNVALPFWEFMNASGLVYEDDAFVEGRLFQIRSMPRVIH